MNIITVNSEGSGSMTRKINDSRREITGTETGLTIKELKGSRMKQNCTDHRQGKRLKKKERKRENERT